MNNPIKLLFSLLIIFLMISCKSSNVNKAAMEKDMYRVSIFYPAGDENNFNMDYYETNHMPMVAGLLGDNLAFFEIEEGISGRTPSDKLTYVAIGSFFVKDITQYHQNIADNREAIVNDLKKYTNIQPIIQVSKVRKVGFK